MKVLSTVATALLITGGLAGAALGKEEAAPPEVGAWADCLHAAADRYAMQAASVETIVSAAFGACKPEEGAVYQLRVKRSFGVRMILGPPTPEDRRIAHEAQDRFVADIRDHLTGYVLERRASQ